MKRLLTAALILAAVPALADQEERNQAYTLIVQDVVEQGLPQAAGVALGQCAIPRLEDAQIAQINAATDMNAQGQIVDVVASAPDFQDCLMEALSQ